MPKNNSSEDYIITVNALTRNFPDSSLQLAQQFFKEVNERGDSLVLPHAYKLLGDAQAANGKLIQAEKNLHNALLIAKARQDTSLQMRLFNNLGGIYLRLNKEEESIAYFDSTLRYGENFLSRVQRAVVMTNIGLAQRHLKRYHLAEIYHLRALQIFTEENLQENIAAEYNNLGILKTAENELELALLYFKDAISLYQQQGNNPGYAKALTNRANAYLEMQKPHAALLDLEKSLKIKKALGNPVALMHVHLICGKAYRQLANYDHSLAHFNLSAAFADSIGNNKKKADVLQEMAAVSELAGDFPRSTQYLKQYIAIQDTLNNEKLVTQLAWSANQLELNDKIKAIANLQEKAQTTSVALERRNLLLMVVLPLVVIIILLTVIYVRRYFRERSANRLLEIQKAEIVEQARSLSKNKAIISQKNRELEVAREIIEASNLRLIKANEALEEQVRERSKAAEQAYRKLALHLDNSAFIVLEWDKNRRMIDWPAQAEQLLGWRKEEMMGIRINELPFPLYSEGNSVEKMLRALAAGTGASRNELASFENKYGRKVFMEWTHSMLLDDAGNLESILSFGLDVTEREQAFNELNVAYRELDTFLYKSSHDLRGPLARLQGIINLAHLEVTDSAALAYFNMQERVTEELNQLLLRLHQVHDIFQHRPQIAQVNLYRLVEKHAELLLRQHGLEEKIIVKNLIPPAFLLNSDENLLSLIVSKVIENCTNFAQSRYPELRFTLKSLDSQTLIFRIIDNGINIPEQYHERMFDLFFQGSTRSTGSGLGLYMAKKAAKRLEGDIRLLSEGDLTIFEIELPVSKQAVMV